MVFVQAKLRPPKMVGNCLPICIFAPVPFSFLAVFVFTRVLLVCFLPPRAVCKLMFGQVCDFAVPPQDALCLAIDAFLVVNGCFVEMAILCFAGGTFLERMQVGLWYGVHTQHTAFGGLRKA